MTPRSDILRLKEKAAAIHPLGGERTNREALMTRRRVLLLTDFSHWCYAAHHAVMEMHAPESLHVVLLVVGQPRGSPGSASAQRFAELMAEAHVARGATAEVAMADENLLLAVHRALSCDEYDLVVAGENLAGCRDCDDRTNWVIIDPEGRVSGRLDRNVERDSQVHSSSPIRGETVRRGKCDRPRIAVAIG